MAVSEESFMLHLAKIPYTNQKSEYDEMIKNNLKENIVIEQHTLLYGILDLYYTNSEQKAMYENTEHEESIKRMWGYTEKLE